MKEKEEDKGIVNIRTERGGREEERRKERLIWRRRSGTSDPVVDWTVQRQRETVSSGK